MSDKKTKMKQFKNDKKNKYHQIIKRQKTQQEILKKVKTQQEILKKVKTQQEAFKRNKNTIRSI